MSSLSCTGVNANARVMRTCENGVVNNALLAIIEIEHLTIIASSNHLGRSSSRLTQSSHLDPDRGLTIININHSSLSLSHLAII